MFSLEVWGGMKWVFMRMSKKKKGVEGWNIGFYSTAGYDQLPVSATGGRDSVSSN